MTYDINADFLFLIVGARTGHYYWGLQEKPFENTPAPPVLLSVACHHGNL